jgi:hypothetical protein
MGDTIFRTKRVETPPFACPGPIQLTPRFTALKESLTSGRESAITSSWQRLLRELPREIDEISDLGSQAIPTISFADTTKPQHAEHFLRDLRHRGVGVIRNVVSRETALAWSQETHEYTNQNPQARPPSSRDAPSQEVYWSPAQVKARAHPNLLAAQKFAMSIRKSSDPTARVTTDFPIAYADRMSVPKTDGLKGSPFARVDGGSVERWEPDGYGRAGTYNDIFRGRWEDYDPWEVCTPIPTPSPTGLTLTPRQSSTRLGVTSDLYHKAGACSIFRMFQGWLALDPIPSGPGSAQVLPLPRLATAYFLLRPFFSPPPSDSPNQEWTINHPQTSILHGALPSYTQEITPSLHPHLDLARSLVSVPRLEPGDYLVWHPDLIHSITHPNPNPTPPSSPPTPPQPQPQSNYLPASPLTQTNALYLARQRKAFLLGHAAPDFDTTAGSRRQRGESEHAGRPGVQDVNDAGGDDGLRAMGLLPWDEEEADEDSVRAVLAMGNGILFPEVFDMV